ncbi:MAG: hypothetical protein OXE55_05730 [Flavobacteriaceae bacterium]|nr:hypothetical protein [Flavobacteriaceae bacterium]
MTSGFSLMAIFGLEPPYQEKIESRHNLITEFSHVGQRDFDDFFFDLIESSNQVSIGAVSIADRI